MASAPIQISRSRRHATRRPKARTAAEVNLDIKAEERQEALAKMTFREMFKITLAQREKQLSNAKHLMQWTSTMEAYVAAESRSVVAGQRQEQRSAAERARGQEAAPPCSRKGRA